MKHSSYFWDASGDNGVVIIGTGTPIIPNPGGTIPTSTSRGPSGVDTFNMTTSYKLNWWKVLGCDCVGGVFGGPEGYGAASCCSIIGQL